MNKHFNDEQDFTNDDGYLEELLDSSNIPQEWLDEEEEYWADHGADPADSSEYDPVDDTDNSEASDDRDEDEWDDETPIGLEYDGYNDPDNY